jgi:hypothetical protein
MTTSFMVVSLGGSSRVPVVANRFLVAGDRGPQRLARRGDALSPDLAGVLVEAPVGGRVGVGDESKLTCLHVPYLPQGV